MEVRSTAQARENVETFAERYIELLKQKKALDQDIKALKQEFKEEGVPVSMVTRALNTIKANKKKTSAEIFEAETIQDWLESHKDIDDGISELAAKQ
jgi:uncharacterized protein (UPF0335 family)